MASDGALEAALIAAIAAARADPGALRARLQERLAHYRGADYFPPERGGRVAVATKEGRAAVEDALAFLAQQAPLPPVAEPDGLVSGMSLSAEDHLVDRGTAGAVGHAGADGSSAADRIARYGTWRTKAGECLWFGRRGASAESIVADLVTDDGVPARGHRRCIFDASYTVAAAKVGDHTTFGLMAVILFAGRYVSDSGKVQRRLASGPPKPGGHLGTVQTQWDLGACAGCLAPIQGGTVKEVSAGKFHKRCFRCVSCSASLVDAAWQTHAQGIHCESCSAVLFAPKCAECGEQITGGGIKYNSEIFHLSCIPKAKAASAGTLVDGADIGSRRAAAAAAAVAVAAPRVGVPAGAGGLGGGRRSAAKGLRGAQGAGTAADRAATGTRSEGKRLLSCARKRLTGFVTRYSSL